MNGREKRKVMGEWIQDLMKEKAWVRDDLSFRDKRQKIRTRDVFMRWYAPNENNIMKIVYWLAKILDTTTARKKSSETFQAAITHLTGWMVEKIFSFNVVVTRQELFEFIDSIPDDFGITVGKCPCKDYTQEKEGLDGRRKGTEFTCQLPVETDVQIGRTARHYVEKVPSFRNIDKQELIELENKLLDLGVVPCIYNVCQGETAICNCSPVSCVPLLANRLFGYNLSCLIRQGKYIAVTVPNIANKMRSRWSYEINKRFFLHHHRIKKMVV